jgi:hypothetical protein
MAAEGEGDAMLVDELQWKIEDFREPGIPS